MLHLSGVINVSSEVSEEMLTGAVSQQRSANVRHTRTRRTRQKRQCHWKLCPALRANSRYFCLPSLTVAFIVITPSSQQRRQMQVKETDEAAQESMWAWTVDGAILTKGSQNSYFTACLRWLVCTLTHTHLTTWMIEALYSFAFCRRLFTTFVHSLNR